MPLRRPVRTSQPTRPADRARLQCERHVCLAPEDSWLHFFDPRVGEAQPDARVPRLEPAHGPANLLGSPMLGGAVMFEPADNALHVMSQGTINNDIGAFTLTTYREGDGALAGRYRVII